MTVPQLSDTDTVDRASAGPSSSRSKALYTYLVLPGNESVLMREALQRRSWWREAKKDKHGACPWHLWFGGNGQSFDFKNLVGTANGTRIANRLENHREVCTKSGLANTLNKIQMSDLMLPSHSPAAMSRRSGRERLSWQVAAAQAQARSHEQTQRDRVPASGPQPAFDLHVDSEVRAPALGTRDTRAVWEGCQTGPNVLEPVRGSWVTCGCVLQLRKPNSVTNISLLEAAGLLQLEELQSPVVVPCGSQRRFTRRYKESQDAGQGSTWIVKPISLNRGNGIEVFNQLESIQAHLDTKKADSKWIVQKYLERPALVDGRKFDIRAYVLVTPDKSVYLCKESYVRTSSTPYNLADLSDKCAHLTNDAVQKHLDSYHKYEDHCKMDMAALQASLPHIDIQGLVVPAMKECVRHLFGMAVPNLNPRRLQLCWELLGLDFMIDHQGQVYLIEVNTSPALFRAGAYLSDLLPRTIEECVQKAIDPYFPPPAGIAPEALPTPLLDNFERLDLVDFDAKRSSSRRLSDGAAASQSGGSRNSSFRTWGSMGSSRSMSRRVSDGAEGALSCAADASRALTQKGSGSLTGRTSLTVWR